VLLSGIFKLFQWLTERAQTVFLDLKLKELADKLREFEFRERAYCTAKINPGESPEQSKRVSKNAKIVASSRRREWA
jgi:hypothetical protein